MARIYGPPEHYGIEDNRTPGPGEFAFPRAEAILMVMAAARSHARSGTPGLREPVRTRPAVKPEEVVVRTDIAVCDMESYHFALQGLRRELENPETSDALRAEIASTILWYEAPRDQETF